MVGKEHCTALHYAFLPHWTWSGVEWVRTVPDSVRQGLQVGQYGEHDVGRHGVVSALQRCRELLLLGDDLWRAEAGLSRVRVVPVGHAVLLQSLLVTVWYPPEATPPFLTKNSPQPAPVTILRVRSLCRRLRSARYHRFSSATSGLLTFAATNSPSFRARYSCHTYHITSHTA